MLLPQEHHAEHHPYIHEKKPEKKSLRHLGKIDHDGWQVEQTQRYVKRNLLDQPYEGACKNSRFLQLAVNYSLGPFPTADFEQGISGKERLARDDTDDWKDHKHDFILQDVRYVSSTVADGNHDVCLDGRSSQQGCAEEREYRMRSHKLTCSMRKQTQNGNGHKLRPRRLET